MSTDPSKRIAKWNVKYNTERIKAVLDEMRPDMYARVQAVFPLLTAMESQVKQVLDLQGIQTINYPWYLCFGREVWKLQRQEVSGEALAVAAANLISKWSGRGLSQAVLEIIRTGVFNVNAPSGP